MVNVLHAAAKVSFRTKTKGFHKHYRSDELNNLKQLSLRAHQAWRNSGSPHNGLLNDSRLLCQQRNKHAIREAKFNAGKMSDVKHFNAIEFNNHISFWKQWNLIFFRRLPAKHVIESLSHSHAIYQGLSNFF